MRGTVLLLLLSLLPVAQSRAEMPRLRYLVQKLGDAEEAALLAPGADGTGYAFLLRHRLGGWSRFNWPVFEPVAACKSVTFRVRRGTAQPEAVVVRLLTEDGNEWQSPRLRILEDSWRQVELNAADFHFFRGSRREDSDGLDFSQVVQFQVVPQATAREGEGLLHVDDIRFLPDGPGWKAGEDELRAPADPFRTEWERVDDLARRWQGERHRLIAERRRVDRWLDELRRLMTDWADPNKRPAVREQLAGRQLAWQQSPELPPPLAECVGVDLDAFATLVESGQTPPRPLIAIQPGMKLGHTRLYAAPAQEDPKAVHADGHTTVRHTVRFSDVDAPQAVFTTLPLPEPMDLDGQRVLVRMRVSTAALNAEMPLVLRLYTEADEGGESWGDLNPSLLPGPEWTEVAFDAAAPRRGARFTPRRTRSIAVRLENQPGIEAELVVELAEVRVGAPDAMARARRILLHAAREEVDAARAELYARRDALVRLEDAMHDTPDLRKAYLASFEHPLPRAAVETPLPSPSPVLAGLSLPAGRLRAAAVHTHTALVDGRPVLVLAAPGEPEDSEILAEMHDRAGTLQAAGRGPAARLVLTPMHAPAWTPGEPHVYTLRCAILRGDRVTSSSERLVGMRTADVRPSGPDALLRHVSRRRQPDWTYRLNGRCWFPRVAAYHWPEAEQTVVDGVRMFGDLWMEGVRCYGFSVRQDEWDRFSRYGLGMFTSLAPSYRGLEGWDDMETWRDDYDRNCRLAVPLGDSPHQLMAQVGNEVELAIWGASLSEAFPDALYQPIDAAATRLPQVVRPTAPVMYVRAGAFHQVPPLPHEQVAGVNQYTGRYGGRVEEIDRNLAELARQAMWADRPIMITEWMGPKYSWAATGIGGVTRRGAAYYLERYWRAMIDTPGIVGSSEFTLNWVIAPFEDLTNQSREEAWKGRPRHSPFGGGYTADHVPEVGPRDAVRGEPTFLAMQAFHGPLYLMVNRPGAILIAGADAERIAAPLREFREGVVASADANHPNAVGHVLRLLPSNVNEPLPAGWDEPVVRTELNPADPDGLSASLHAATPEAARRGVDRLVQAAEALAELNRLEGAMTRAVALTDKRWAASYESYLLEFAARGYLHCGDDVRLTLDAAEFFAPDGGRRPAWQDISAVLLDTLRTLSPEELALVERLTREGVNLIVSAPCYAANPGLTRFIEAELAPAGTLADAIPLDASASGPVPVRDLGSVRLEAIRTFRPDLADSSALNLFAIDSPGASILAADAQQRPIVVRQSYGRGTVALLGASLGAAIEVHRNVTRAGKTHRLYDRDTACGLERLSRVAVNLCLAGCEAERHRPRLYVRMTPEATWVAAGEPARIAVSLTDVAGRPIAGQLRVRLRTVPLEDRGGGSGDFVELEPVGPGLYQLCCLPEGLAPAVTDSGDQVVTFPAEASGDSVRVLSAHFKGFAPGYIPADAAVAVLLAPRE